jgi:hypothetical protein
VFVAASAIRIFRRSAPEMARMDEVVIDGRILLYTVVVTVGVAVVSGLVPALRASRARQAAVLHSSARTVVSARVFLRSLLVDAQVALSVVLLAGAGLLLKSFIELSRVDRGFDAAGVLTFRVSGSFAETADVARLRARIDATLQRLREIPGVTAAATALFAPGVPAEFETTFTGLAGVFPDDGDRHRRGGDMPASGRARPLGADGESRVRRALSVGPSDGDRTAPDGRRSRHVRTHRWRRHGRARAWSGSHTRSDRVSVPERTQSHAALPRAHTDVAVGTRGHGARGAAGTGAAAIGL